MKTIEEKAKAYDETVNKLRRFMEQGIDPLITRADVQDFFSEFAESEDEKIRKFLIKWIQDNYYHGTTEIPTKTLIAWLEKQGSEPNWCHHKVDLSNCSEEYRKAYYDGWNNCNQQHSQCKSDGNDVVKCLINGMKFYYEYNEEATWGTEKFSMKVKDILSWLEKQRGEMPADKIKPKFKIGDGAVFDGETLHITNVTENGYSTEDGAIPFRCEKETKPWTIADAKNGDVLTCNEEILLFKSYSVQNRISLYCWYNGRTNNFHSKEVDDTLLTTRNKICPATKEQRDTLFAKMKEAGYEWDVEKKQLNRIEQKPVDKVDQHSLPVSDDSSLPTFDESIYHPCTEEVYEQKSAWSEEDENRINRLIAYFEDKESFTAEDDIAYANWLKSIRPQKQWKPTKEQMDALLFVVQHYTPKVTDKIAWDSLKTLELMYYEIKQ